MSKNFKRTAVTKQTIENLVIDSGVIYKNYVDGDNPGTLLGATRDGNTFNVEREMRTPELDGAKGPVKGLPRLGTETAKITAKFAEFTTELIQAALPGTEVTDKLTHDEIRSIGKIALSDYCDNIVIVGEKAGSKEPVICGVENALSTGGFDLSFVDDDESGFTIEFTGHYEMDDLTKPPWFIRNPKVEGEEPGEAGLLDLTITGDSPIALDFVPATHNYEVAVTQASPTVIITATVSGVSKTSITFGGETTVNPSWKLGVPVALVAGANVIVITVNVGSEFEVYTITINYTEG